MMLCVHSQILSTAKAQLRPRIHQSTLKSIKSNLSSARFYGGNEPSYQRVESGYNVFKSNKPFHTRLGGILPELEIAYETWGTLAPDGSNAVLLHTGLSANSHAASHPQNRSPGWWETFIGPWKPLDTNKYFIICTNLLGGCYGSTGPSSINPETQKPYGSSFPMITVNDMVTAQFMLLDHLGINKVDSVGASLGGMQSLLSAALFPDRVKTLTSISSACRAYPLSIAFRSIQRQIICGDPNYRNGDYYEDGEPPLHGMALARQVATLSYRSGPEWDTRFGRRLIDKDAKPTDVKFDPFFSIEGYLHHQGSVWQERGFDPNSLLYISKAMDLFDMAHADPCFDQTKEMTDEKDPGCEISSASPAAAPSLSELFSLHANADENHHKHHYVSPNRPNFLYSCGLPTEHHHVTAALLEGMSRIVCPALIIGIQSDILFPSWQQSEIARLLTATGNENVVHYELDALYGHDTFLIDVNSVGNAVKGHLANKSWRK